MLESSQGTNTRFYCFYTVNKTELYNKKDKTKTTISTKKITNKT